MKNIDSKTLIHFLQFACDYAKNKYIETYGTIFVGNMTGKQYNVSISTEISSEDIYVCGSFYNGLEDDTVESMYVGYDEILEAYNKDDNEYNNFVLPTPKNAQVRKFNIVSLEELIKIEPKTNENQNTTN